MNQFVYDNNPTVIDSLKRDKLLLEVAEHIKDCSPPQVIGLFGDWGSGKTSFLGQLQLYLSGTTTQFEESDDPNSPQYQALVKVLNLKGAREGYPVVWFEAWRYQNEPQPVVALIQEIRKQFAPGSKFWNYVSKSGQVALETALLSLDPLTKYIGASAKNAREIGERYERERFETPPSTTSIRNCLDEAIRKIVRALDTNADDDRVKWTWTSSKKKHEALQGRKLVVIIDDLDRCEPEAAWALLEGIKVFLNLQSTVFILGINQQIIEDHLAFLMKDRGITTNDQVVAFKAREYLEKLCPVRYHLPNSSDCSQLIKSCEGLCGEPAVADQWVQWTDKYLPKNPRKIKAFLNVLRRFGQRSSATPIEDTREAYILAYMYYFHHRLYRLVEMHPAFYNDVMVKWAANAATNHSQLTGVLLPSGMPTSQDSSATSGPTPSSATLVPFYLDSVLENVFHLQDLLKDSQLNEDKHKRLVAQV